MIEENGATIFQPTSRARGEVLGAAGQSLRQSSPILSGARTRKGTLCKAKALHGNARCRFYGGASTGPKTPEGRARIAEAQRQRWAKWRMGRLD
ncbi:HGGxSTG domain-containing protein [Roseovarius sp. E0-M6]|uniref:HGGxSTG domain-containing protein n=1 Tax=Roseovarius sp. E0-M6 TaxID=3127118 RepID=UPI00300FF9FE